MAQDRADSAKTEAERQKCYNDAITHYTEAIVLNPEDAWSYSSRGFAYAEQNDFEAAIEDYNKAIDLAPENAWVYNGRGNAYGSAGDFGAAIEDFSKAIDLAPENALFYSVRGVTWLHLKEWQKAKADLTTAKDMGWNIVARFHKDYESVEDFEAKNGVTLPKDIAALLQRK